MSEPVALDKLPAVFREKLGDGWLRLLDSAPSIHLAVFREPFLKWILDGTKKIETRFSINNVLPFSSVSIGDVVLLKRACGPVVGAFTVDNVYGSRREGNDPRWLDQFRQFSEEICANEAFWTSRAAKQYATLVWVDQLLVLEQSIRVATRKGDRRAWIVLRSRQRQLQLANGGDDAS